jgi:hypothetical protein
MSVLLETNVIVDLLNGHEPAREYLGNLARLNISDLDTCPVP